MTDPSPEAVPPSSVPVAWPTEWPVDVRRIADATVDALAAVVAQDPIAFDEAVELLDRSDAAKAGNVHAEMVRSLLEEVYSDGLTGENVQEVLGRTVRGADWLPSVDIAGFVEVLTGALGVTDVDEQSRSRPRPAHALLVVADLLAVRRSRAETYVRRALAEIHRAQTVEMP
ncbi:hypothetical protein CH260_19010 [Rhodococcus sp. 05-2256-B2]|uniref:hypothetical protein n=1 Tax=unclassified Rhodococcus (in: high G+C Gram-positive bacteria) TaxID=192944 RepID=UPI000B9ABD3B|nr:MULTISPECIES: hypothetical protein [unclassified Rhodococcus (in: high G+C Gram-positive bacteria)]OZD89391.1 hypothetical protein CH258_07815 [Rhodococcus sp. 05-2256-B4]OZD89442.1 hypothetical protein CH257_18855 [Rhodococcus sp. 05-2256-B3]OZD92920.1 hypothetical protein CH260_19010 [Rhodococcus sp. 05-2256-B2]OZD97475.1 hypothetical protein CH285_24415 [Rhodococcus sp. 05-2256-B1]